METLEELREKYKNLNEKRTTIYNKIVELEQQEINNKFTVGECYLTTYYNSFKKIIKIDNNMLYCIVVEDYNIRKSVYPLKDTNYWKKITSEQFKDIYFAVMKDIQDPDLEDKEESNWDINLNSIVNSINKEKEYGKGN